MSKTLADREFLKKLRQLKKEGIVNIHITIWDDEMIIENVIYTDWILFTPSGAISSLARNMSMSGTTRKACAWVGPRVLPTTVAK